MSTPASTTALRSAHQDTRSLPRPHPLVAVIGWELRRFRASRLFWLQALLFFGLVLFVTWVSQMPSTSPSGHATFTFIGFVAGTSAWGLLLTLPRRAVAAGAAPALCHCGRRVPGPVPPHPRTAHDDIAAYFSLCLGTLPGRLADEPGPGTPAAGCHSGGGRGAASDQPDYPSPSLGAVLLLWVGMVVTATVLVSSLSFALGTVFLRQATLVKIVILLAWFVGALVLPGAYQGVDTTAPAWYVNWDPTSASYRHSDYCSLAIRIRLAKPVCSRATSASASSAASSSPLRTRCLPIWPGWLPT